MMAHFSSIDSKLKTTSYARNKQTSLSWTSVDSLQILSFGVSRAQHDRVLAWTSLWILLPFLTWLSSGFVFTSGKYVVPWCIAILLPFSCGISVRHWLHNVRGSIIHRLDMTFATLSLTTHAGFLLYIERAIVAAGLGLALTFFFALARLIKKNYKPKEEQIDMEEQMQINWEMAMIFHTIFRYFAFWLAMSSHSYSIDVLDSMGSAQWLWFVTVLTSLYILSIMKLMHHI